MAAGQGEPLADKEGDLGAGTTTSMARSDSSDRCCQRIRIVRRKAR
jgi:hypothetical protein